MFEEVLSEEALDVIEAIAPKIKDFYLAGGTGLALQLGHRKSEVLDFFSSKIFNTDVLVSSIPQVKVIFSELGTLHLEISGVRVSLLYYEPGLMYPTIKWREFQVADIRDIAAEKIKTISQRGAKKDFIDLFAILKMKYSIQEVCGFFRKRFKGSR